MFQYVRNTMGIAEKQQLETAKMEISVQAAEQEKQSARLDYIAMMADIELPDAEEEAEYAE